MSLFDLPLIVASLAFWLAAAVLAAADEGSRPPSAPRLKLLRRGISRHRCPYVTHPAAAKTEFVVFQKAA